MLAQLLLYGRGVCIPARWLYWQPYCWPELYVLLGGVLELRLVEEPVRTLVPLLDTVEALVNDLVLILCPLIGGKTLHTPLNALLQWVAHRLDILKPMVALGKMTDEDESEQRQQDSKRIHSGAGRCRLLRVWRGERGNMRSIL